MFFDDIKKVKPSLVKGIIIGVTHQSFKYQPRSVGLFVTTGRYPFHTEHPLRETILNEIDNLTDTTILHLRFPFIRSEEKHQIDKLIDLFYPVMEEILEIIYRKQNNKIPIPIFCLGRNGAMQTYKALTKFNFPKFNVLQSVHPLWFLEIEKKISDSASKQNKRRLKKQKHRAFNLFKSNLSLFKHMTSL